jgi:HEPN domain-containing protein
MRGLAVWEFHMAAEKSFKLFLQQQGITALRTHNLLSLCERAEANGLAPVDKNILNQMPSDKQAIAHRYGELDPVSNDRIAEIYAAALNVCLSSVKRLRKRRPVLNTKFLIKRAAWAVDPDGDIDSSSDEHANSA